MQHYFMKWLQMAAAFASALLLLLALASVNRVTHTLVNLFTHTRTHLLTYTLQAAAAKRSQLLLFPLVSFSVSLRFFFILFFVLRNCKNTEAADNSARCVRSSVWRWRFKLKICKQAKEATKLYAYVCICVRLNRGHRAVVMGNKAWQQRLHDTLSAQLRK